MDEHVAASEEELRVRVEEKSQNPENWFLLGKYLYNEQRLVEAEECFQKAIDLDLIDRNLMKLHTEVKYRLGPAKDEDCTIYVRDPHKQLNYLIDYASQCNSWFRREVPGVYEIVTYLNERRNPIDYQYYRVASLVVCVFSHNFHAALKRVKELIESMEDKWTVGMEVRAVATSELKPYIEVLLKPYYEAQEMERLVLKEEIDTMLEKEHTEEKLER